MINPKDKKIFKTFKGVVVVEGRHLSHFNLKRAHLDKKTYSWRVHGETHNLKYLKPGHVATAWNVGGKTPIVIERVYTVTGSVAMKVAKQRLKPVINCWEETWPKPTKDNLK